VVDIEQRKRFGTALSSAVTPITFNRPRRRNPRGLLEMYIVSRAIQRFDPDLFHPQNYGLWESVLLRMIGNIPVINTVHDPIQHIDYRNPLNNGLARDAIYRAKGWVVHSDGLKQVLLEQYPVDPRLILVHPHGVLDYYCRFASSNIQREKYILFFGEPRINKGFDILLRVFESIKDEMDDWKIVVAGKGQIPKDMNDLIKHLGNRIDYQNQYITDAEVGVLFSQAGIVALPYRHGSQSGVLAIAAAFGCPVLATPVGNMAEIMENGKHALFVEPDNEKALAEGLLRLAGDEKLRVRLGKNLGEFARSEWSWDKIARSTVDFYAKIL
jgi:glycosyltransferase involved in cell wall biosynthesis